MDAALIAQILAVFGAIVTGILTLMIAKERTRRHLAEKEMDFQAVAMEFAEFVNEWQSINKELEALIRETKIDRVLILRAWNGAMRPRWTTAILQVRESSQEPISYQHYELDADYVDRLKMITAGHPLIFKTDAIPECGIKAIYEAEGVVESMWAHIGSKDLKNSESRAITYASFSTLDPEGFDDHDITRARLVLGRLKGVYLSITPAAIDGHEQVKYHRP